MVIARLLATRITSVLLCALLGNVAAQSPTSAEAIEHYTSIGRIKWIFPPGFDYIFAVPDFTMGPRIMCNGREECVIGVVPRDLRKTSEERQSELTERLQPELKHTIERSVEIRVFGASRQIFYVTLSDPKEDHHFYTTGYAEKGPALIQFNHMTNDQADIQRFLSMLDQAEAIDAVGVWAWKLGDYKGVCEKRFPAYAKANAQSFSSSMFAAIDITETLKTALSLQGSPRQIREQLKASRDSFAESLDREGPETGEATCKDFPRMVSEAAKGLVRK